MLNHVLPNRVVAVGTAASIVLLSLGVPVSSQTLQDRIDAVRMKRALEARERAAAVAPAEPVVTIDSKLAQRINFRLDRVGFRESLERWSARADVPMFINWAAMENDGVDPEVPVTLELEQLPAAQVLLVLMDVGSTEFRFIAEVEPWGVQVRTREQANRDTQVRVYDVADLVMAIPSFDDAPELELGDVLEASNSSGGGQTIFQDDSESETDELSKQERGEALAETIRQTVEPDVWQSNGGEYSSMRYVNGRLIVRAPAYVHSQIGGSAVFGTPDSETGYRLRTPQPVARSGATPGDSDAPDTAGVSGVEPNPQAVSGIDAE